jgi:predicted AAA+ superfamily ATPase
VYDSAGKAGLVKSKKLFWSDCGLGAHLAGFQSAEGVEKRPDCGFWLEQAIYQSVRSWVSLDPYERKIWYWRDRRDREVDFILQKRDKIVAMEIKRSGTVRTEDSIGLKAFAESVSSDALVRSVVLHGGTQSRFLGEKVLALPWGWLFPK